MEAIQFAFIPFFAIFAIGGVSYCLAQLFFVQDKRAVDQALQSGEIKEKQDIEAPEVPDQIDD